ncbi:MAG: SpoIID/LytB domain-containing protein [Acidobacteriota bacterium]
MPLEQYVAATVAGESRSFQSDEALKAMAVAARTYAVHFLGRHRGQGFDMCEGTHCQRVDVQHVTPRIAEMVRQTAGELLWYRGQPAMTYYTQDCGGQSEDANNIWPASDVPYLKTHTDPYCKRKSDLHWHWEASAEDLSSVMQGAGLHAPRNTEKFFIAQRAPSGRALWLSMFGDGKTMRIKGASLRLAVISNLGRAGLPSDRYNVGIEGDRLIFEGSGFGHGVGMCQKGAEEMGLEDHTYREILAFYYPGTTLGKIPQTAVWSELSGEYITLSTTQPWVDGALLASAERQLQIAAARVGLNRPPHISLRIYPTVEAFREATGEVASTPARTSGQQIHMQPVSILRSQGLLEATLQRELLLAAVEQRAVPMLPVWFRDGLVSYLAGPFAHRQIEAAFDFETTLLQRTTVERIRFEQKDALQQVTDLMRNYGQQTVIGWLKKGMPRDVDATKSPQLALNR